MTDHSSAQFTTPGRRAAAYWFSDGLPELTFGLMVAIWGAVGMISRQYEPRTWQRLAVVLVPGFTLLAIVGSSWGFRFINWLKTWITYPRTGYVKPPEPSPSPAVQRRFEMLSLFAKPTDDNTTSFRDTTVLLLVWTGLMSDTPLHTPLQAAITGLVVAGAVYLFNRRGERPYAWWSAALLFAVVAALPFTPVPDNLRQHAAVVCAGLWMLGHGAVRLALYLRRNRLPQPAEQSL